MDKNKFSGVSISSSQNSIDIHQWPYISVLKYLGPNATFQTSDIHNRSIPGFSHKDRHTLFRIIFCSSYRRFNNLALNLLVFKMGSFPTFTNLETRRYHVRRLIHHYFISENFQTRIRTLKLATSFF